MKWKNQNRKNHSNLKKISINLGSKFVYYRYIMNSTAYINYTASKILIFWYGEKKKVEGTEI